MRTGSRGRGLRRGVGDIRWRPAVVDGAPLLVELGCARCVALGVRSAVAGDDTAAVVPLDRLLAFDLDDRDRASRSAGSVGLFGAGDTADRGDLGCELAGEAVGERGADGDAGDVDTRRGDGFGGDEVVDEIGDELIVAG